MSTADETRAALQASKEINKHQQALTEESRLLLAAMLREEMTAAVTHGIRQALLDEALWRAVVDGMQQAAVQRTGSFVLGGLKSLGRTALWTAIAIGALYAIGGLAALKAAWAIAFGSKP